MSLPSESPAELAMQAREALAASETMTLLIQGVGRVDASSPILMHDDRGRPTFICPRDSAIACSVGRLALLSVPVNPRRAEQSGLRVVVIAGALTLQPGTQLVANTPTHEADSALDQPRALTNSDLPVSVVLSVTHVVVERDEPGANTITQHEIPVDLYTRSDPDALLAYADSVLAHTNNGHREELTMLAAQQRGIATTQIVSAWLAALDRHGAELRWIDVDGAHRLPIIFDQPAQCPRTLGRMLREQLTRT
ncbi:hypothetical protein ACSMXN_04295 [Jatrophihabitans sp. DSM 45814]